MLAQGASWANKRVEIPLGIKSSGKPDALSGSSSRVQESNTWEVEISSFPQDGQRIKQAPHFNPRESLACTAVSVTNWRACPTTCGCLGNADSTGPLAWTPSLQEPSANVVFGNS